jgi:hypothetical protein
LSSLPIVFSFRLGYSFSRCAPAATAWYWHITIKRRGHW